MKKLILLRVFQNDSCVRFLLFCSVLFCSYFKLSSFHKYMLFWFPIVVRLQKIFFFYFSLELRELYVLYLRLHLFLINFGLNKNN
jgi:hypothetical protein